MCNLWAGSGSRRVPVSVWVARVWLEAACFGSGSVRTRGASSGLGVARAFSFLQTVPSHTTFNLQNALKSLAGYRKGQQIDFFGQFRAFWVISGPPANGVFGKVLEPGKALGKPRKGGPGPGG